MSIGDNILLPLLRTSYLLVFHATRLLPHEKEDIKANGLQILTKEFAAKKIREAVEYGYLAERIGNELQYGTTSRDDSDGNRTNQICVVFGKSPFRQEEPGLSHFFEEWGGEFINYTDAGEKYKTCLKQIGEPAIVKALLPITDESSLDRSPELTVSFIEAIRGESASSTIHLNNEAIPSKYILNILRPEDMANEE